MHLRVAIVEEMYSKSTLKIEVNNELVAKMEDVIWKPESEMSFIAMYAIHLMNEMHNYDEDVDPINT